MSQIRLSHKGKWRWKNIEKSNRKGGMSQEGTEISLSLTYNVIFDIYVILRAGHSRNQILRIIHSWKLSARYC